MPDRAVADCTWCNGDGYVTGSVPCPECTDKSLALCARSEDGQWLVMKPPQGDPHYPYRFFVYCWKRAYGLEFHKMVEDTGQDAHEVLAQFLKERGG